MSKQSELTLCSVNEIELMREQYPAVADDYFKFMRIVGWGDIGGLMIYSGLIEPDDLLTAIGFSNAKIVVFGDNWQGSCYGFNLENEGELIEITPDGEIEGVDHDFNWIDKTVYVLN